MTREHHPHDHQTHVHGESNRYQGYKVPAAEVTRDGLAKILHTMATAGHGRQPSMVVDGWSPQLNTWDDELLSSGDPTQLTWDEANVGDNTNRALAEFLAWMAK